MELVESTKQICQDAQNNIKLMLFNIAKMKELNNISMDYNKEILSILRNLQSKN